MTGNLLLLLLLLVTGLSECQSGQRQGHERNNWIYSTRHVENKFKWCEPHSIFILCLAPINSESTFIPQQDTLHTIPQLHMQSPCECVHSLPVNLPRTKHNTLVFYSKNGRIKLLLNWTNATTNQQTNTKPRPKSDLSMSYRAGGIFCTIVGPFCGWTPNRCYYESRSCTVIASCSSFGCRIIINIVMNLLVPLCIWLAHINLSWKTDKYSTRSLELPNPCKKKIKINSMQVQFLTEERMNIIESIVRFHYFPITSFNSQRFN